MSTCTYPKQSMMLETAISLRKYMGYMVQTRLLRKVEPATYKRKVKSRVVICLSRIRNIHCSFALKADHGKAWIWEQIYLTSNWKRWNKKTRYLASYCTCATASSPDSIYPYIQRLGHFLYQVEDGNNQIDFVL